MQSRKFRKSDFFGHGSIFKIKSLRLKNSSGKDVSFAAFYPEADIGDIEYAVVCTQDCDIEQEKVSHLNIALLEPISRHKKENPVGLLNLPFSDLVTPFEELNFYSEGAVNSLKTKVDALINNTDSHHFFVDLNGKFHFINLAKMFPVKFSHLPVLKAKVRYQLDAGFKYLLGWKLANLYGRVGVESYPDARRKEIEKKILKQIFDSLKSAWPPNSHELSADQLASLKQLLGPYNQQKKAGKDSTKAKNKIFECLVDFGFLQAQNPEV